MKKEVFYCDKCGKEIGNPENIYYIKAPTEKQLNRDNSFRRFKNWKVKELCNDCLAPIFEIFNSN
jgi:DNA replicative helicase MCM subunit Mcm2 (Cdc46/Mcm family)